MPINTFKFMPKKVEVYDHNDKLVASADSKKLASLLYGGRVKDVGILPPAVRWLSSNGSAALLERPPHTRAINVKGKSHNIKLPWTLWLVTMDSANWKKVVTLRMFARSYPLSSEQDTLGLVPLPFVKPNGSVKMPEGSAMTYELANGLEFGNLLEQLVDRFFSQNFGEDFKKFFVLEKQHVPADWGTDPVKIIEHMSTASQQEITFTEYAAATPPTLAELIEEIDPTNLVDNNQDALEFLGKLVKEAGAK